MTLKETIIQDSTTVFLNEDDFAESIEYHPRSGGTRTILAIVNRAPPALMDSAGNVLSVSVTLFVANSSTDGINSREIDTGGDQISLPARINRPESKRYSIVRVLEHDHGMLQVALQG